MRSFKSLFIALCFVFAVCEVAKAQSTQPYWAYQNPMSTQLTYTGTFNSGSEVDTITYTDTVNWLPYYANTEESSHFACTCGAAYEVNPQTISVYNSSGSLVTTIVGTFLIAGASNLSTSGSGPSYATTWYSHTYFNSDTTLNYPSTLYQSFGFGSYNNLPTLVYSVGGVEINSWSYVIVEVYSALSMFCDITGSTSNSWDQPVQTYLFRVDNNWY